MSKLALRWAARPKSGLKSRWKSAEFQRFDRVFVKMKNCNNEATGCRLTELMKWHIVTFWDEFWPNFWVLVEMEVE
jgi:hypothetical protein